ncbi:MAG TPA: dCTP deaminase [Armatimonadota bacterium]|jgi:dCTP deaminase
MILSGQEILQRMKADFPDKLVVTPLLDKDKQLRPGSAGIDVRLGQDFIIADRALLDRIDPQQITQYQLAGYLRRVHVPIGDKFTLHPHQFALGATIEYCRLPRDLSAEVMGRSRWARVGLVIAMATFVVPGFAGCLTLELQNLGDVPLNLIPGLSVAQLIFYQTVPPDTVSTSQFQCSIGPEFPVLVSDEEKTILKQFNDARVGSSPL